MNSITITKSGGPTEVHAVCVDAIDHGVVETPWGDKPRFELVFETDAKDELGMPKVVSRTFNFYTYPKAALTLEMKNWLGSDISGDDDWDGTAAKRNQATLRVTTTVSAAGNS